MFLNFSLLSICDKYHYYNPHKQKVLGIFIFKREGDHETNVGK